MRSDDLQGVDFDFRAFSHPASARTKIAMELAMSHQWKGSDFLALALIDLLSVVGRIFSGRLEAVESTRQSDDNTNKKQSSDCANPPKGF